MRSLFRLFATTLTFAALGCAGGTDLPTAGDDPEAAKSPVGSFTLTTVNGVQVPMLWGEMDVDIGYLRSYWMGGKLTIKSDSTFSISFQHKLTGPGLPGNTLTDSWGGTWRLLPGGQLQMTKTGGGVATWLTTDIIYTITINSSAPGLDGSDDPVQFIFVRD